MIRMGRRMRLWRHVSINSRCQFEAVITDIRYAGTEEIPPIVACVCGELLWEKLYLSNRQGASHSGYCPLLLGKNTQVDSIYLMPGVTPFTLISNGRFSGNTNGYQTLRIFLLGRGYHCKRRRTLSPRISMGLKSQGILPQLSSR